MLEPQDREDLSALLKALAHPVRLHILDLLGQEELEACEIANRFPGFDRTTISKHLAKMRDLGIVLDRREGVNIKYRLPRDSILPLLHSLAEKAHRR